MVSIITPVLNGARYLEACLQSISRQSYPRIEHLFVDGGSTDGTLEMLMDHESNHPTHARCFVELGSGIAVATNKGLKLANGEILGWLSCSDTYEQDAVSTVVGFFKSNPSAYFVFGNCNYMDENGHVVGKVCARDIDLSKLINDRHQINLTAAFYRRAVVERVGVFNPLASELDFYVRVAKIFPMHRIEMTLSNSRVHRDAVTAGRNANKRDILRRTWQEDFRLRRREGASIFAPSCRKYLVFLLLDKLRLYYFVNATVLIRLRRYRFIDNVLRTVGL